MIDGHGDDIWRFKDKVKHNFSTNIHSAFDHSQLMEHIALSVGSVTSYPEPEPRSVESLIASINGVDSANVMVTNGATESIYLLAQSAGRCHSAIIVPTFSEYKDACKLHSHRISLVGSLSDIPDGCDMVWLCNPNNPTGKVTSKDMLLNTAANHPETVFIIDQAYADYTLLPTLTAREAVDAGNIILLGSLTKRFGVPGLRIGYSVGCAEVTGRAKQWRMPWSVNGPAISASMFLIQNRDKYMINASRLHDEAMRISRAFSGCGITVYPSDCNFILCELPHGLAAALKQYLIESVGILIRDASNFDGLGQRHFRVAAQLPDENDLLIDTVRKWITS